MHCAPPVAADQKAATAGACTLTDFTGSTLHSPPGNRGVPSRGDCPMFPEGAYAGSDQKKAVTSMHTPATALYSACPGNYAGLE